MMTVDLTQAEYVVLKQIIENKVTGIDDYGSLTTGPSRIVGYRERSMMICRTRGCYTEFPIPDGMKIKTDEPLRY